MNIKKYLLIVFVLFFFSSLQAQNSSPCAAERLCESKTLNNDYPGGGNDYVIEASCGLVTFSRSVYYKVIVKSAGSFTFKIKPNDKSDYDWALWKNISNCSDIRSVTPDRFSANDGIASATISGSWDTGMDISKPPSRTCEYSGRISDGMLSALNVIPGDELLLGINLSQSYLSDYKLVFGGDGGGGENVDFLCIEGYPEPYYVCDLNDDGIEIKYDLDLLKTYLITEYLGGDASHNIIFYETQKDVVSEINPITRLDITDPGKEIFCRIIMPNGDVHATLAIDLRLTKYPKGENMEVVTCGNEEDLTIFNSLLSTTPDIEILYYKNISDAQNEVNPLSMPTSVSDGQKFYAVIKNNKGDCSIIRELTIGQTIILPIVDNLILCSGDEGQLVVNNPSLQVNWYNEAGTVIHTGNIFPFPGEINNGTIPVVYTYYVENKSEDCHSEKVTVTVTVNPQNQKPIVNINLESLCANAEAILTVINPKGEVRWYNSEGIYLSNKNSYVANNITKNTTYYVEQKEGDTCISERISVEILVPVLDKPKVNGETICVDEWVELKVINSMGEVFWYDNLVGGILLGSGDKFSTPILENHSDSPISYFYYAEQKYCHNASERTRVEVIVLPKPEIGEIIKSSDFIEVLPKYGNISDYLYSIDGSRTWQNSNIFRNLEEGKIYSIEIKNKSRNCLGNSEKVKLLKIPNFISPNGDGINDIWKLENLGEVEFIHLRIFDRYGKILYETTDSKKIIWDGRYQGRSLPTTSYWYTLQWIPKSGKIKEVVSGWIALKN